MIVIDGQQTNLAVGQYANLDELLVSTMRHAALTNRIITDVIVNDENFSEIYPRQAEDIPAEDIRTVEIISMPVGEMAVNITRELYKVVTMMSEGGRRVADLFRQADDSEALELFQDLLDVTRDFLGMIGSLRDEFSLKEHAVFTESMNELSGLFGEMLEVMENEDWILLSDLLEYEYLPAVERWKKVVAQLREDIRETNKA